MPEDPIREQILALPKAELHVHLDGSLRPETMIELAREQGVSLPAADPDVLADHLLADNSRDLDHYLQQYAVPISLLQTPQALERAAFELVMDVAGENVRYLEVRYSPALHTQNGMSHQDAVDAVLRGLERGEAGAPGPILTGLIVCGIRSMDPATSVALARVAVANRERGVVAFDLAGPEAGHPASHHREAFQLAAEENLPATVHAGEGAGPESIREALQACHARRLGHGTRLREDPELEAFVRDHRIPLEVCLTSNAQTRVVPSVARHPLRHYFDAGLEVTLNTDSRLISGTTLSREYELAQEELGFSPDELARVSLMGFRATFLPGKAKESLLREVGAELAALGS